MTVRNSGGTGHSAGRPAAPHRLLSAQHRSALPLGRFLLVLEEEGAQ